MTRQERYVYRRISIGALGKALTLRRDITMPWTSPAVRIGFEQGSDDREVVTIDEMEAKELARALGSLFPDDEVEADDTD